MKKYFGLIVGVLTLLLSSFNVEAKGNDIESMYPIEIDRLESEIYGTEMQIQAINTQKVAKIEMVQYGKQVIPTNPIKYSEDIVNQGTPLFRVTIKVKATDISSRAVSRAAITASTTSTAKVKGIKTSGYTDSSGVGYIYLDVRGATRVNVTVTINNYKQTLNFNTVESCKYESSFRVTGYITCLESDYTGGKVSAKGISGKTFKSDFLKAVKLNGSGVADNSVNIYYNKSTSSYSLGSAKTATGTTPTAGRTIAVDNYYVPMYRVSGSIYKRGRVNIEGIGIRTAEDSGGAIKKYHIDVYLGGWGKSLCQVFQL